MADRPGGEERGESFEDLFEDLDRFFAPGEEGAEARRSAEAASPPTSDPSPSSGEDLGGELLPEGWEPDVSGLDLEAAAPQVGTDREEDEVPPPAELAEPADPTPSEPAPEVAASSPEPPAAEPEPAAGDEEPPLPPETPRTAEMSGEEWRRLRDVLGEEEEVEGYEVIGEEPAGLLDDADPSMEDGSAWAADADEEAGPPWADEDHELTLDDLRKAPPEYERLPRGEGEEEPILDRSGEPVERMPWEDTDIAEVEAAADRIASEFTTGPDEPPMGVEDDLLADVAEHRTPRTIKVGSPEQLTGPTWEEPGSHVITSEPAPPRRIGGRDLPMAVITGAVLAVLALVTLLVARPAFAVLAGIVVLLGQFELYTTMQRRGHQPAVALGLVAGAFLLAGAYLKGEAALPFFVVLALVLSFLWYMAAPGKSREGALANLGGTMLGLLYVPLFASFILVIVSQQHRAKGLTLAILGLTFAYDIAAYLGGSLWGRTPLAPTISPRKTWQGLMIATALVLLLAFALLPTFHVLTGAKAIGMGLVVVIFAPLGDLAESMIKRDLGVKDMGSILPGHGGILDRIDSVLFVLPAAFYFLRLVA